MSASYPSPVDNRPPVPAVSRGLLFLLLFLSGFLIWQNVIRPSWVYLVGVQPAIVTPRGELAEDEKSTIELFNNASPSVVNITTSALRRDFFTRDIFAIPQGSGTGIVWDSNGHIVTNFHVIEKADTATITMSDQTSWKARLVGVAPQFDIAVLKIDSRVTTLQPLPIGTSGICRLAKKCLRSEIHLDWTNR